MATDGKIVATVRSPAVARLRLRQSVGTIAIETAPYAAAIANSGTALKSSVFVSVDTGATPDDRGGTSPAAASAWMSQSACTSGIPACKNRPSGLFTISAEAVSVSPTGRCEPRRAYLALARGEQLERGPRQRPPRAAGLFQCLPP